MHLEHVNLTVSNLDRSVAFYCDLLDLSVRWKGERTPGSPAAHVGDDRFYLALFEATEQGETPYDYEKPGFNHMGFVVDDIEEAHERLDRLGAEHGGILSPDDPPRRVIYGFDPDGHEIELVQY